MYVNSANVSLGINQSFELVNYFKSVRIQINNGNFTDFIELAKASGLNINYRKIFYFF